jgi:hypothetical protein
MKNILFVSLLVALSSGSALSQTISAADQKGIDEMFAAVTAAFDKGDATMMTSMLDENAQQIIPTGEIIRGRTTIIAGLTGYMAFLKSQPKPDRMESKRLNLQYRYLAPGIVLATYTDENTMYFGSKTTIEKTTNSLVTHNANGKWVTDLIDITTFTGK